MVAKSQIFRPNNRGYWNQILDQIMAVIEAKVWTKEPWLLTSTFLDQIAAVIEAKFLTK